MANPDKKRSDSIWTRFVPNSVRRRRKITLAVREWIAAGRPLPPPHEFKQKTLLEYANRFHLPVLVETGTFRGEMVAAMRREFLNVYSLELDDRYFEAAVAKFKRHKNVEILHGDSGSLMPDLLNRISGRTLFWLDGHYSGDDTARGDTDTPVLAELEAILSQREPGHVILIDDARLFGGATERGHTHHYPTIDELKTVIERLKPGWGLQVADDIIRIHR